MIRILFLFIIVFLFSCTYQSVMNITVTKDGIIQEIKKEKTINAVQTTRQKRHDEAERIMNVF